MKLYQKTITKEILAWFKTNGRKDLPWQKNKTAYRVWVSEIMLQQTQVSTVIAYFLRFMDQFPSVEKLSAASEDEVLHLWTGLGYYQRARNLHRTAKIITENYQGRFPENVEALRALPGIGLSTAGAILAIAFNIKAPILDGNVKRVLARFYGVTGWSGEKKIEQLLWQLALKNTPEKFAADYTQAIMDLGATVCTRANPLCNQCPLTKNCYAKKLNIQSELPSAKPQKKIPVRQATLLIIQNKNSVLLKKRSPTGVWGNLWSFPEFSDHLSKNEVAKKCSGFSVDKIKMGNIFRHTFSHFHLDILPVFVALQHINSKIMEDEQQIWYNLRNPPNLGLPAPIKSLLSEL